MRSLPWLVRLDDSGATINENFTYQQMSLGNCGCVLVSKDDITSDKINGVQYEHIFYISVKCICTFTTEILTWLSVLLISWPFNNQVFCHN